MADIPGRDGDEAAPATDALEVFISYSRRDSVAAETLRDRLIASGTTAYLDKHDIKPGEAWRERLGGLIESADAVVFLISPDSIISEVCDWEVNHAELVGKRIVPVVCRDPTEREVPPRLSRLNYLFMRTPAEVDVALPELKAALEVDIEWVRRHTRYGELALEWERAGRPERLLLRGEGIAEAEAWRDTRPSTAPETTAAQSGFIAESRRAATRRQRRVVTGSIAAAIVAVGLAATAVWFGIEAGDQAAEAARQRLVAEDNERKAVEQADIARQREMTAVENETVSLVALSRVALAEGRATDAVKLALAAWPRRGSESRPRLRRNVAGLAAAFPRFAERLKIAEDGMVLSAMFSPDGKRVLTSAAGKVRVWDRSTGERLLELGSADGKFGYACFSPDGRYIAAGSADTAVRIWDAGTGKELLVLKGHSDAVYTVAYSADGNRIVTASPDRTARVWDAATGEQLLVLSGHSELLRAANFSADGTRIVTGAADMTARIWDARTGAQLRVLSLPANNGAVFSASFSPDGRKILTSSLERDRASFATETHWARIWDAESGAMLVAMSGHSDVVGTAAFSPDGSLVATSSWDGTVRVWAADTGVQQMVLKDHDGAVFGASFSPDGTRLATASADATARVWRVRPDAGRALVRGKDIARDASFSPDGRWVGAGLTDTSARFWETDTGTLGRIVLGHTDWVLSAAFSPDGSRVLTASRDKTARIWDFENAREILRLPHRSIVSSAAFASDGSRVLSIAGYRAHVWSALDGASLFELGDDGYVVRSAAFSPDGRRIVTVADKASPRIWDAMTGRLLHVIEGHTDQVREAVFSPDGSRLVTTSSDLSTRIWDTATGEQILILPDQIDVLSSVRFSPDGARLLIGSSGNKAQILDASDGTLMATLEGHGTPVRLAVFSPDGKRVATITRNTFLRGAEPDYSVRLWDAATGAQLLVFGGQTDGTDEVKFSPDGKYLLSQSSAIVGLWDLTGLEAGDAFQVACQRLGNNISLKDVQERYGLRELAPICGDNAPLPVDWSTLQ